MSSNTTILRSRLALTGVNFPEALLHGMSQPRLR